MLEVEPTKLDKSDNIKAELRKLKKDGAYIISFEQQLLPNIFELFCKDLEGFLKAEKMDKLHLFVANQKLEIREVKVK